MKRSKKEGGISMIIAEGYAYEIVENVRNGFQEDVFLARYSDVLVKYDYIVGDWGYGQLRMKGFFDDRNQKSTFDTKISTFEDYLFEYCNFGCAYFILRKIGRAPKTVELPTSVEDSTGKQNTEKVEQY